MGPASHELLLNGYESVMSEQMTRRTTACTVNPELVRVVQITPAEHSRMRLCLL